MKKRGLDIHLKNRLSYTLIAIFIIAAIGVYAYQTTGTANPAAMGHTINEVAPPSPCSANQYLQFDGTNWKCVNLPTSLTKGTTAIYLVIPYCVGAGVLTLSTTCSSAAAGTCLLGQYTIGTTYYDCSGTGAIRLVPRSTNIACYSSSDPAPSCPNTLLGYFVN